MKDTHTPETCCQGVEVGKIKAIYLYNSSDVICDSQGNVIRMKRKYGKFKREVIKLDNTTK